MAASAFQPGSRRYGPAGAGSCPKIGVIAAPRAAGIREDQDALLVIHEGGGFREVGRPPGFRRRGARRTLALPHDAARPARDLGHEVGAEALDDLVKRPGTGGSEASFSISASRLRAASRHSTGWPSRTTGRDDRLPSLSVKGS